MIHDPLALAVALDESVCALAEVELGTQGDLWGCWPSPGSGTWISVDYDEAKFRATLLAGGTGSPPSPPASSPGAGARRRSGRAAAPRPPQEERAADAPKKGLAQPKKRRWS